MTIDELRAKFEAWAKSKGSRLTRTLEGNDYWDSWTCAAWVAWQAAHASRDAEVEALKRDAERYRWLRDIGDITWTPLRERMPHYDVDKAIDAAMAK